MVNEVTGAPNRDGLYDGELYRDQSTGNSYIWLDGNGWTFGSGVTEVETTHSLKNKLKKNSGNITIASSVLLLIIGLSLAIKKTT